MNLPVLTALLTLAVVAAMLAAVAAWYFASLAFDYQRRTKVSADLTADVLTLQTEMASARSLMKRINSRENMRELRAKGKAGYSSDGPPDWRQDPDGFRRYHEERLKLNTAGKVPK